MVLLVLLWHTDRKLSVTIKRSFEVILVGLNLFNVILFKHLWGEIPASIQLRCKEKLKYIFFKIRKGRQTKNKFKCKELAPFLHDSVVKRIYSWKYLGVFFFVYLLKRVSSWSFKYVIFSTFFFLLLDPTKEFHFFNNFFLKDDWYELASEISLLFNFNYTSFLLILHIRLPMVTSVL